MLAIGLSLLTPSSVVAQSNSTLLVSAAASLKDVMEEIKPLYQQAKPNVNMNYNFGASGALLQQIQQGVPPDVFIWEASEAGGYFQASRTASSVVLAAF